MRPTSNVLVCALVAFWCVIFCGGDATNRFLIVSQPNSKSIRWMPLQKTDGVADPWRVLVQGVVSSPRGLALDQRNGLFVADESSRSVYRFQLEVDRDDVKVIGDPLTVATTDTQWVATDSLGNVFMTDASSRTIKTISWKQMVDRDTTPIAIFDVADTNNLAGIAADNFHLYWANQDIDREGVGVVLKGKQPKGHPRYQPPPQTTPLARNVNKASGLCQTPTMLYFSGESTFLFGVNKKGGEIATVSEKLLEPKGCAWDGDATIFVADSAAGRIYSLPASMRDPSPAVLSPVARIDLPFGVAVVTYDPHVTSSVSLTLQQSSAAATDKKSLAVEANVFFILTFLCFLVTF